MLIPLRVHTGFSFLKSGLTVEKYVSIILKNNIPGGAICDEGVLYGVPSFIHLLEKRNKIGVVGMEIKVDNFHLCLYALNEEGYRNLLFITSITSSKEEIDYDSLKEHTSGLGAIIVTNDQSVIDIIDDEKTLSKNIFKFSKLFSIFYLGVEILDSSSLKITNKIREFASSHSYSTIALPLILYEKENDDIVLKIVDAVKNNSNLIEKSSKGHKCYKNEAFYKKYYSKEEIELTNHLFSSCQFKLEQKRGKMLEYDKNNASFLLKTKAFDGLKKRKLDDKKEYVDRLNYELDIILSLNYANYFLLVADYVSFAKKENILVGPGRGSAAGSLVSYVLNITEIDPIKYDLSFERFLNPSRQTMPDIDIDFMDYRRDEVVMYLREKYGKNRVSNIVTFQTIHAKQALRDIGRVYSYNDQYINILSKTLGESSSLREAYRFNKPFKDLVDSDPIFLEIVSLAAKIELLPRQRGMHAAGIILNDEPLELSLPIINDDASNYTSQYEMNYLQEEGFIKMDLLGLKNLSIIVQIVTLINSRYEEKIDPLNIPFDNPKTYELIRSGLTMGVFQLESEGMKKSIDIIKPNCFDDVVALLALFRPGPMDSIPLYGKRKQGLVKTTYLSKELEKILKPTYGIIVYQEQVSAIASEVAGFTPAEADNFRRAISKKDENILVSLKDNFIDGATKKGMEKKKAEDIYAHILKFANYGFNKSHSVAYGVISCQMAYLKAMYPMEFYACLLDVNDEKFFSYMDELKKRNINIIPPNVNLSFDHFIIKDNALVFPLMAIKRIDTNIVKAIINERKNGDFKDFYTFIERLYSYGLSEAQAYKLIDSGALDCLYHSRETLRGEIKSAFLLAKTKRRDDGQVILDLNDENMFGHHKMNEKEDNPLVNLEKEFDCLGMMLSGHPLEHQKERLDSIGVVLINEAKENGRYYTIAGLVRSKRIIKTKNGGNMAFITLFDQSGVAEIIVFQKLFDNISQLIINASKNTILLARVKKEERNNKTSFIAENIEKLEVD